MNLEKLGWNNYFEEKFIQERFESYIKQLGEIKRLSKEKRQYEIFKSRKSKRGCM